MNKGVPHVRVGLFVVLALGVAFFLIFMIGSDKKVFEARYRLVGKFTDISGLRIGAPVQLAGINIGFVDNIKFSKDLMNKEIEVSFEIADKYRERIREDSVATINTQGLLGDKFIFVSVGSADQPELKDGAYIKTREVVGIFDLADKGGEILDDLQDAAQSISKAFGGMSGEGGDLSEMLKSIKNMMKKAETGSGFLHALIYDPNGQEVMADLTASMHSLRTLLGQTDEGAMKRSRVRNVVYNINDVALNLRDITEKINRGEGTIGGLVNDPTIYNEIRSIFGKANRNSLFKTVVRSTLEENEKDVLK